MRKLKMRMVLIALAAVLVTLFTQQTLAYYSAVGTATNVVTSGDIKLVIHEKTPDGSDFPEEGVYVIPGDVVGKRVTIENVCGHPFYLRVKLVRSSDNQEIVLGEAFKLDLNTVDWFLAEDGYLYYNTIVQPGETTNPVFTEVEIVGGHLDQFDVGTTLSLTVNAQAVQSEHNPAEHPWEAAGWPAE